MPVPLELGVGGQNRRPAIGQEGVAVSEGTEPQLIPRGPPEDKGKMEMVEGSHVPTCPCLGSKERPVAGGSQLTSTLFCGKDTGPLL